MAERTFRLDKLVRDDIVLSHQDEGGSCVVRQLTPSEIRTASDAKIDEEVAELKADEDRGVGEYADVIEVLLHDAEIAGHTREEIFQAMNDKTKEIGSFSMNTYIETVTVPEDSWLAEYYSSKPRFPEILGD